MKFFVPMFITVFLVGSFGLPCARADDNSINPGETYKGELGGEPTDFNSPGMGRRGYTATLSVSLKAGQTFSAMCVVTGKTRRVDLELFEPTGKSLGLSTFDTKTVKLNVEEVNATGIYKLVIGSDLIGPFRLDTDATLEDQPDIDTLVARIKQLQAELADAQAQLKTAQESLKK